MNEFPERERPSQFDGTQYVIFADLPPHGWTTADLFAHVYGVRLDDGAKPWPYFRDPRTRQWWSLSSAGEYPVDALAWMIDLDQLAYKQPEEARMFLESVLPELGARARQFGGVAVPEMSMSGALQKMHLVREMLSVRDYRVSIVIASPGEAGYRIAEWWKALAGAGLAWGDGDLFWLLKAAAVLDEDAEDFEESEDQDEPYELFCAEPYSVPGYFHPGDLGSEVRFPDVALHFRARDVPEATNVLRQMYGIAQQVAGDLRAELRTNNGQPFDLAAAEMELGEALQRIRDLDGSRGRSSW